MKLRNLEFGVSVNGVLVRILGGVLAKVWAEVHLGFRMVGVEEKGEKKMEDYSSSLSLGFLEKDPYVGNELCIEFGEF